MKKMTITNLSDDKKVSLRDLRIADINQDGLVVRGRKEYLAYLSGQRITLRQAVSAHCYDCQGFFADGRAPCPDVLCPLWPWSHFRNQLNRKTTLKTH
jgi:hypothetical protein